MCAFERSEKGMEFFMDDEKDIIEVEKVEDKPKLEQPKPEEDRPHEEKKKPEPKEKLIPPKDENSKRDLARVSLILGIVALVLSCVWHISSPCGILAIVFGAMTIKSASKNIAIAGIITGAIGMVLSIIIVLFIMIIAVLSIFSENIDYEDRYYHNYNHDHYNYRWDDEDYF